VLTAARASRFRRPVELTALVAVVALGFFTRVSGFNHATPWFDDAWVVLSSKVGIGTAVHMVNTTPLFSLAMRSWILLHPNALWWDQLPVFVLGLGTVVAAFYLLRSFKPWWPVPYLGALVIAVSPIAVLYSTRVKQYNLDFLFAAALVYLFERWRREPTRRVAAVLAVAGALAVLTSATTLIVAAPVVVVMAHAAFADRRRIKDAALCFGAVAGAAVLEYAVWLRHLSNGLDVGWTARGYLLTFKTAHKFAFSLQTMFGQFFHWMIGVPTGHPPDPSKLITPAGAAIAVLTFLLLAGAILWAVVPSLRRWRTVAGPMVVPALTIGLSAFLAFIAVSPFGGGRTDLVIYPSILLLLGGVVTRLATLKWRFVAPVLLAGAVVAVGASAYVGATNRAVYPTIGLRQLYAEFTPYVTKHEFIVVDPWLDFAWADDALTPTSVSFQDEFFNWSQGFHVDSDDPVVIISNQYFFPDAQFGGLSHYATHLWYIGEAGSPAWPATSPNDLLYATRDYLTLIKDGWVPTSTQFHAAHVVAILMKFAPRAKG
jgi:hypothetical protein